ncbi:hypothetical protein SEA_SEBASTISAURUS_41 [Streptomyces phage Sebastisaurus]|uniref:Uncharacterized protein n=1 Tax=Streptomyces phage Sebastisaurus TaxID=2510572 RepID=A0A411B3V5_9CAUD|nr:hypothetical protein SEA_SEBASTISAURUS_41 [Streptomyces phage Sebastisaurus]
MTVPEFKPPVLTSRAQRAAEDLAERVDTYRVAMRLIREATLVNDAYPEDVLALARFLSGETPSDN